MARPTHSRSRPFALAALAALLVVLLAPASALAGAAVDEYSLGTAGGGNRADVEVRATPEADGKAAVQLGVVGENEPGQSPLAALGPPVWIGLLVLLASGAVAVTWGRSPRSAA